MFGDSRLLKYIFPDLHFQCQCENTINKIKNLLGPPPSYKVTDIQTYRVTTRGPGGPKKPPSTIVIDVFGSDKSSRNVNLCLSVRFKLVKSSQSSSFGLRFFMMTSG